MSMLHPLTLLLIYCSLTITVPQAVSQQKRSTTLYVDYRILADVQKAYTDKLFAGASISPVVDHGVVTLTGAVRNDTQKDLASREIAHIPGVTSVLNKLEVSKLNQPAKYTQPLSTSPDTPNALTAQPAHNSPTTSSKVITIGAGATLSVQLSNTITSKTAKQNDAFDAVTTAPLIWNGYTVLPVGTHLVGRIIESRPAGHILKLPILSIDIVAAQLPDVTGHKIDLLMSTHPLTSSYANTTPNNSVPPKDIELEVNHPLQFHLAEPLAITIELHDGHQITPQPQ